MILRGIQIKSGFFTNPKSLAILDAPYIASFTRDSVKWLKIISQKDYGQKIQKLHNPGLSVTIFVSHLELALKFYSL